MGDCVLDYFLAKAWSLVIAVRLLGDQWGLQEVTSGHMTPQRIINALFLYRLNSWILDFVTFIKPDKLFPVFVLS